MPSTTIKTNHTPTNHLNRHFITDEEKLAFLKRFGWLMDDKASKDYSARFTE